MTARRYAATTEVSVSRSKEEIECILSRYGASAFGYAWEGQRALVNFKAQGRYIRFILPLPNPDEDRFVYCVRPSYQRRTDEARTKAYEQACRQVWRALKLVIQAKLEAVEAGITTFEDEFLAHIVLPNGETVGDYMRAPIEAAYQTGELPSLVALGPGKAENPPQ